MIRIACIALGAVLYALCLPVEARQPEKVRRIGFLAPFSPGPDVRIDVFKQALRDLGHAEGQSIAIEYRWANGRFEQLPQLAAELVRLRVDVIVSVVTQASIAAQKKTSSIPIVMVAVSDPVGAGLVSSLARPGANVTGTSSMTAEIVGKQLELLKEAVPNISRAAALWNPANPVFQALQLREAEMAARLLRLPLQILEARGLEEIERAFGAVAKTDTRALVVLGDPVFTSYRQRIADLAVKQRLAAISGTREHVEAGALMAYGPSFPEMYRRSAWYVDKILRGAKPADLPVEQPTKFELVINLKTAKQIGVTMPPNVLARADRVIR